MESCQPVLVHCLSLVSGSHGSHSSFAPLWHHRYKEIRNPRHAIQRRSTPGRQALFPGCFSPLPTRTLLHPQGPSPSLSLKPQTNSLATAFSLAAFSTFKSLFTSSVTSYPLPIKASSTIRDLRFLWERIKVSKPL